ncbi:MAG: fumarate reductase/succinate dehydrogenase flavoprotein subunit, partial [Cutibacterium granulosum]
MSGLKDFLHDKLPHTDTETKVESVPAPKAPEPASASEAPKRHGKLPRDIMGPAQKAAGYEIGDELDGGAPAGDPLTAWTRRQTEYKLVNPANRRKMHVIVVGAGLAGSGVAATLGQLGYKVDCFVFHDSPRRAHSVAAQGGINAARARKVDGDSLK